MVISIKALFSSVFTCLLSSPETVLCPSKRASSDLLSGPFCSKRKLANKPLIVPRNGAEGKESPYLPLPPALATLPTTYFGIEYFPYNNKYQPQPRGNNRKNQVYKQHKATGLGVVALMFGGFFAFKAML